MIQKRRWSLWAGIIYAVILIAVTLGLGRLYLASRDRLDEAMGDRLLAVANSLAVLVDAEQVFGAAVGDPTAMAAIDSLSSRLHHIRRLDSLSEITICDPDGKILFSTLSSLAKGARNDYWDLDSGAAHLAGEGFGQATRLYRLQDTFQKSAHAPIILNDPFFERPLVVGVMTVSGNPDFFDSLARLRQAALLTAGAVLLILSFLGFFLHRVNRSLERYQASILRQENLAAMGRMTAGIAHEIRNPLGIIRGAGQHLQTVLADAGIEDETVDFIPEEVDRLDHILTGYLAFGTERAGPRERFDLAQVAHRGVDLLRDEFTDRKIEVRSDLADPVDVSGDPRRLQQVILNLLLNARDAMPAGGSIDIELNCDPGWAHLSIVDQGSGLGDTDPERLFEPFRTTKEKGSGLGLALSRQIVEEIGGTLELKNHDEGGAMALLRLPLAEDL